MCRYNCRTKHRSFHIEVSRSKVYCRQNAAEGMVDIADKHSLTCPRQRTLAIANGEQPLCALEMRRTVGTNQPSEQHVSYYLRGCGLFEISLIWRLHGKRPTLCRDHGRPLLVEVVTIERYKGSPRTSFYTSPFGSLGLTSTLEDGLLGIAVV